ncbi:O-antigen biosynthesis glycosyltransferase WbnK [Nymphon striatum]|nr:O-antigen biosynthesis glycosyltransferase WbnK [Nymphon striatum]
MMLKRPRLSEAARAGNKSYSPPSILIFMRSMVLVSNAAMKSLTARTSPDTAGDMIYSRVFGGLGNQLFQYAAARAVSLRLGTELVLDTRLAAPGSHWACGLLRQLTRKMRNIADHIAGAGHSVSLHMRRGDYLGTSKSNATYATCDEAYYLRALAKLSEGGRDIKVFVFSDDPEWVRENLKLPYDTTAVGHNGPDLRLMSCCTDHVIANSTFSWWGGWLDRRPDARVVGPAKWFNDPKLVNPDILPDRWIAV